MATICHVPVEPLFYKMSAANQPTATAESGDIVVFDIPPSDTAFEDREARRAAKGGLSHGSPGPLAVVGAEPGMALRVKILDLQVLSFGGNIVTPHRGIPSILPVTEVHHRIFNVVDGRYVEFAPGLRIPLRPMIGTIGVAPKEGEVSNRLPGDHGGNLDVKEIRAGNSVYFPVFHRGALLGISDLHGMQGDGEVCGTALETGGRVTIQVEVVERPGLRRPLIESAEEIMTVASAPTAEPAMALSLGDLVALLEQRGLAYNEAFSLCSLAADLRVAQIVNNSVTIYTALRKELLPGPRSDA